MGQDKFGLWQRMLQVHPDETDGYRRKVLQLVAGWHLLTIPLGPLLAAAQIAAGESHRVSVIWLVLAPVLTAINYRLTLSRYGWRVLDFQVGTTFALVAASLVISPDRNATTMALILPVLAGALCYGLRRVLVLQGLALAVVAVHALTMPSEDLGSLIGAAIVVIAAFAVIAAIVRLREHLVEERLREAREEASRARALLDASFDGVADVVGGCLTVVSPGFEAALGYEEGALKGRRLDEVFGSQLSGAEAVRDAMPFLDAQGELRYLTVLRQQISGPPSDLEVVAVRDRTRDQMHKANLLFSDRMAAVGTLAAGVAHEVNNALMTLVGHSDLGQIHLANQDLDRARDSYASIGIASDRIASCVRQLQRFGDARESEPTSLDLNQVTQATLRLARHRLRHATQVDLHFADELPPCFADERSVEQIVMNLLLNALHAVTGRQERRVTVTTFLEGAQVGVRVADTGVGVPEELREQVFQPFFTTKGEQGTGLGLSISASLAARMGGSLRLEASDGGATFCLRLPITEERATPAKSEPVPGPRETDRILVVDDEPDLLEVFRDFLLPASVTLSASVEQAKAQWVGPYDLVLSDVIMPSQSGLVLRDWVAREHPEALPQLVLMTGSAVGLEQAVAELPSEQRVVQKPIQRVALHRLLATLRRA